MTVTEDGEHTMIIKNRGSGRKTERITYLDRYTANGNTGPVKTGDTEDLMAFVGVFLSALIILYICMVRIAEDKKTIR